MQRFKMEKNLQKEIQYLTSLIQGHKKSSTDQKPTLNQRWATATRYNRPSSRPHAHKKKNAVHYGNRVYKPMVTTADKEKLTPLINPGKTVQPNSAKLSSVNLSSSSSTVVEAKKAPGNRVYKPASSSKPSSSAQTVETKVKSAKNDKTTGSKFKWKRQSVDGSESVAPSRSHVKPKTTTPKRSSHKRSLSYKNSRFKWRRRLSSGSKESTLKSPTSPLIAQSKFKLTRASLLSSYSLSPFSRRRGTFRQRKLSYRLRNAHKAAARRKSIKKSKNRVWIATAALPQSDSDSSATTASLIGREKKTSRGNKQWVASSLAVQTPRRKKSGLVSLRGDNFVQDKSGKKLKRVSALTPKQMPQRRSSSLSGSIQSPSVKQYLASRVLRKSRVYVWSAKYKEKSKQYCMFYNKFGKCNHKDTCPYIHDPDKIAVCTKFLRGVCEKTDGTCLFSHKLSRDKMPVCLFFLRGVCVKENCPYLHVSVGREAELCMDFARGYCPRGEECTMQHLVDCPEYLDKGNCSRGKTCPLRHNKKLYESRQERLQQKPKPAPVSAAKEPFAFKIARRDNQRTGKELGTPVDTENTIVKPSSPLDWSTAPDFIAL